MKNTNRIILLVLCLIFSFLIGNAASGQYECLNPETNKTYDFNAPPTTLCYRKGADGYELNGITLGDYIAWYNASQQTAPNTQPDPAPVIPEPAAVSVPAVVQEPAPAVPDPVVESVPAAQDPAPAVPDPVVESVPAAQDPAPVVPDPVF